MMQANELQRGDLFIESSNTGIVWEFELFDDEQQEVIARRVLIRYVDGSKYGRVYWRRNLSPHNNTMNPYAEVRLIKDNL